jgi:hypothetical protein
MLPVKVTVTVNGKVVPVDQVKDQRISVALKQMGRDVGTKLAKITCPEHDRTVKDVRIHVGRNGDGDLKYDSCCEKLTQAVSRALG